MSAPSSLSIADRFASIPDPLSGEEATPTTPEEEVEQPDEPEVQEPETPTEGQDDEPETPPIEEDGPESPGTDLTEDPDTAILRQLANAPVLAQRYQAQKSELETTKSELTKAKPYADMAQTLDNVLGGGSKPEQAKELLQRLAQAASESYGIEFKISDDSDEAEPEFATEGEALVWRQGKQTQKMLRQLAAAHKRTETQVQAQQRAQEQAAQVNANAETALKLVKAQYPGFGKTLTVDMVKAAANAYPGLKAEEAVYLAHRNAITKSVAASASSIANAPKGPNIPGKSKGASENTHPKFAVNDLASRFAQFDRENKD